MNDLTLFQFEKTEIRVLSDSNGESWLVARDVAQALGKSEDFFARELLSCVEALFCGHLIEEINPDLAREWTTAVSRIGYNQKDWTLFSRAYSASSIYLAWAYPSREVDIVSNFKMNISKYIPGAKITKGPKTQKHQPDSWVLMSDGDVIPVEAKKGKADKSALNQILRYMRVFSRNRGILVAKELATEIPDNVIFIQVKL